MKPFICTMPMRLDEGWNQIQFNLSDFTRRAYGTNYIETLRVQVHSDLLVIFCVELRPYLAESFSLKLKPTFVKKQIKPFFLKL